MKFFYSLLLPFSLMVLLVLSGCQSTDRNNDIFQYKDSFVGDNSAVGNMANQLRGADELNDFELKTNEKPYGIILNYDWTESEQKYKESVIHNATYLFTLVQNVGWITFNADIGEYTIAKENLQEWYGQELNKVESEDELKELIRENVADGNSLDALIKEFKLIDS